MRRENMAKLNIKALMELTDTEDLRDTFRILSQWGDAQNFTFSKAPYSLKRYMKAFIINRYINTDYPATSISNAEYEAGEKLDDDTKKTIRYWIRRIGA